MVRLRQARCPAHTRSQHHTSANPPPTLCDAQWHVVDYNLFTPGQPLPANLLTVVEQMPGPYVTLNDQTPVLRSQGYWVSYNRIRTPWLFDLANQTALVAAYGDHYSYNLTARARIFARDAPKVVDEPSLIAVMRYNAFQTDPLSVQGCADNVPSASNAIAERGDLTNPNASCIEQVAFQDEAAVDCKYTTAAMLSKGTLASMAQSGPTTMQQAPFRWSAAGPLNDIPHVGQPDLWDFPWVKVEW